MKGHIAAQIATTCRKGQHHPLTIYLANGHEDGYTTFVAFRLIDEFMQENGGACPFWYPTQWTSVTMPASLRSGLLQSKSARGAASAT
jgi:hypothetical protein